MRAARAARGDRHAGLDTINTTFLNRQLAPEPEAGPFGVCFVAFSGTHNRRYRGERLLEVAATQMRAASPSTKLCVVTDQPHKPRRFVDLVLPLRTSADATPYLAKCAEYDRRFGRHCHLFFGYMAKAIAVMQSPYATTLWLDTDTFLCDAGALAAVARIAPAFDVALSWPRSKQGWVNSGVLLVRRAAVGRWAPQWLREFLTLDDFGDQLHLLKVLPPLGRSGALRIGELPPEVHFRFGAIPAQKKRFALPSLRGPGPPMLIHSKGLATLTDLLPELYRRANAKRSTADATATQLLDAMGGGTPEERQKGEAIVYSPRTLAGFCALLGGGAAGTTLRVTLDVRNGGNSTGAIAVERLPMGSEAAVAPPFECTPAQGSCGIKAAALPDGSEALLPDWAKERLRGAAGPVAGRRAPGTPSNLRADMPAPALKFYVYEELEQWHVLECWPAHWHDDQTAEIAVLRQLLRHPSRTNDPEAASLFVVPVLPYASLVAGDCLGVTHEVRMRRAAAALSRSPYLQRSGGRDHLLLTNTFRMRAIGALRPLLHNATVAWFEDPTAKRRGPNVLYKLALSAWRCTIVLPYLESPFCEVLRSTHAARPPARSTTLFFQGSFNASGVRRQFGALRALPGARVLDRPRVAPADSAPATYDTGAAAGADEHAEAHSFSKASTARAMLRADFCLVPKGDTPTTSRFFSAVACGCVPIVISDHIRPHLPFASRVPYDDFAAFVAESDFHAAPVERLRRTMEELRPRLPQMQAALAAAAPDVTFSAPQSRVADNVLSEWPRRCRYDK